MQPKFLYHLKEVFFITLFWVLMNLFFVSVKYQILPENVFFETEYSVTKLSMKALYQTTIQMMLPLGLLLGIFHSVFYAWIYQNKSFLTYLLFRTVMFFMFFILAIMTMLIMNPKLNNLLFSEDSISNATINLAFFWFVVDISISLVFKENKNRSEVFVKNLKKIKSHF